MRNEIKNTIDNRRIISEMFALEVKQAMYKKSLAKVCDDLGIDKL